MSNTNSPRFSHDCECCAHVGRVFDGKSADGDVWFCLPHKELIIRFSDRPDHNIARSINDLQNPPLPLWSLAESVFGDWRRKIAGL